MNMVKKVGKYTILQNSILNYRNYLFLLFYDYTKILCIISMLIFGTENAIMHRIMIGHKYLLLTDLSDEFSELY